MRCNPTSLFEYGFSPVLFQSDPEFCRSFCVLCLRNRNTPTSIKATTPIGTAIPIPAFAPSDNPALPLDEGEGEIAAEGFVNVDVAVDVAVDGGVDVDVDVDNVVVEMTDDVDEGLETPVT